MAPGNDYDTKKNPDLTPFIQRATDLTDRVAACAASRNLALTATEQASIEENLAAHFYQMSDKGYTSRSTSGASGSFQGQATMRLEATFYGQNAMLIDVSGCLTMYNKRAVAGLKWLGKTTSEQKDFDERN